MYETSGIETIMQSIEWYSLVSFCLLAIVLYVSYVAYKNKTYQHAFIITLFSGIALFGISIFDGVLADSGVNNIPFYWMWIINLIALSVWIFQLFGWFKYRK